MKCLRMTMMFLIISLGCLLATAQATVMVCPEGTAPGPDCYIFDGPPCADWSLAGSTCTDIYAQIVQIDSFSSAQGSVAIEYHADGFIKALVTQGRDGTVKTVTLMDFRAALESAHVGVAARITPTKVSLPLPDRLGAFNYLRTVLSLEAVSVDLKSLSPLERAAWSADITDLSTLTGMKKTLAFPKSTGRE